MRPIQLVAALAALLLAGAGNAASSNKIDSRQAELLASSCFNCHGTDGRHGRDSIPAIGGKNQDVLLTQLLDFKADQVPGATVMNRLARGFSDAELAAIARYFSKIKN